MERLLPRKSVFQTIPLHLIITLFFVARAGDLHLNVLGAHWGDGARLSHIWDGRDIGIEGSLSLRSPFVRMGDRVGSVRKDGRGKFGNLVNVADKNEVHREGKEDDEKEEDNGVNKLAGVQEVSEKQLMEGLTPNKIEMSMEDSGRGNKHKGNIIQAYHQINHHTESGPSVLENRGQSALQVTSMNKKDCLSIKDTKTCKENKDCFYDDAYSLCFWNCAQTFDEAQCNEISECRFEKVIPMNVCVNEGYQFNRLFSQDFHGVLRGCVWFQIEENCKMMTKHFDEMKADGKTLLYQCKWIERPSKDSTHGKGHVCANLEDSETLTPKKMQLAETIAKKEAKLIEISTNAEGKRLVVCSRPKIKHATFDPDNDFYNQGQKVTVKCTKEHLQTGVVKEMECTKFGAFEPSIACIPKSVLSESQEKEAEQVQALQNHADRRGRVLSVAVSMSLGTLWGALLFLTAF